MVDGGKIGTDVTVYNAIDFGLINAHDSIVLSFVRSFFGCSTIIVVVVVVLGVGIEKALTEQWSVSESATTPNSTND